MNKELFKKEMMEIAKNSWDDGAKSTLECVKESFDSYFNITKHSNISKEKLFDLVDELLMSLK